jgi:hypothetical protein
MRCERCQGTGLLSITPHGDIITYNANGLYAAAACSACGGSGVSHCCDGDRAEPCEPEKKEPQG